MYPESTKRITIKKEISLIPDNKLDEVKKYIESILTQADVQKPVPVNLKGIWKDTGLEKIIDIETEILNLRKSLSSSVLNKKP